MQLPQVTPWAATHTTNNELAAFANNTVNDHKETRKPDAVDYVLFFFFTALQLLCFSRTSLPLFISYRALVNLFLLFQPYLLCWSSAASHPCAPSAADWLTWVVWCALWWLNKKQKSLIIQHNACQRSILNGSFNVCENKAIQGTKSSFKTRVNSQ